MAPDKGLTAKSYFCIKILGLNQQHAMYPRRELPSAGSEILVGRNGEETQSGDGRQDDNTTPEPKGSMQHVASCFYHIKDETTPNYCRINSN